MKTVDQLVSQIEQGVPNAAAELLTVLYDELRKLAAQKLAKEAPGQTLQATALVHEAWLRLGGDQQPNWENRAHFFASAAEAMRRILVDRARRRQALRRGSTPKRIELENIVLVVPMEDEELLRVHEALDHLAADEPLKAELVKLRFFTGLKIEEAAKVLHLSPTTAKRHWTYARAWLYRELRSS